MIPFQKAKAKDLATITTVYLDIDDTLSSHGKLTAPAYSALWKLKEAGFRVVPVTGRPAGWCDHIARFWPVDAVIGENGAFVFEVKRTGGTNKVIRTYTESSPQENRKKLEGLYQRIAKEFVGRGIEVKVASDQAYREFDLAIDWCEDVKAWPRAAVQELIAFCEANGAHAKLSSIHVNIWFGSYDKITGIRRYANGKDKTFKQDLFIGDSPNDAPAFAAFDRSVGVANLKKNILEMKSRPRWITKAESGKGFAEMVGVLLKKRALKNKGRSR